jgi:predicted SprT family Zn-dependent metalloprotease
MNPSKETYLSLEEAYFFFNQKLFQSSLPACLITLQRDKKSLGYFHYQIFEGKNSNTGTYTDEIALNPDHFSRNDKQVLATLTHEMVHLWQHHHGKPSRASYHNREWAEKMEEIGLMPSNTGEPGGKKTGQKMTHYIIPGGLFDKTASQLLATGATIHWTSKRTEQPGTPKKKKKSTRHKFTCPDCGLNVWARPGANVMCGDCGAQLEEQGV